jgi:hypothetical protein
MGNAGKILVENSERKRALGRARNKLEDNIEMGIKERGCGLDSVGSG